MTSTDWPARPLMFTALGALSALAIFFLVDDITPTIADVNLRTAVATSIAFLSLSFALTARRDQLPASVAFAIVVGLVTGGIAFWRLVYNWPHHYNFAALVVALLVLAPFYQTTRHSRWHNYNALHHHAWSNAVTAPLGLLFVGLTFAMAYLLAGLFSQAGIEVFSKLLRRDVTGWVLGGAALGASLGVLREYEGIIASTQRLVQGIFSLLTCPLAIGLGGFLLVLPFTGLQSLWNNTHDTSATLFSCALAALVFLNSVVRENTEHQSHNRYMNRAATVLAICVAPLAILSALAIRLRVVQYGWTPDRLWATVICTLLVLYGFSYWLAVLRWRRFNETIRQANLVLAILICSTALLLATPLIDFGKHSANNQLARLHNGVINEEQLDLTALAYDFGPAGREALTDLKATASTGLGTQIDNILNTDSRYDASRLEQSDHQGIRDAVTVINGPAELPARLIEALGANAACRHDYCYLLWTEDRQSIFLVNQHCNNSGSCHPEVALYRKVDDGWLRVYSPYLPDFFNLPFMLENNQSTDEYLRQLDNAAQRGNIEIRPVQRLQVFIDGHPLGPLAE